MQVLCLAMEDRFAHFPGQRNTQIVWALAQSHYARGWFLGSPCFLPLLVRRGSKKSGKSGENMWKILQSFQRCLVACWRPFRCAFATGRLRSSGQSCGAIAYDICTTHAQKMAVHLLPVYSERSCLGLALCVSSTLFCHPDHCARSILRQTIVESPRGTY